MVFQRTPLRRSPSCVLSRAQTRGSLRIDPPLPRVEYLPPLSFLTTLTGCSASWSAGLLHPATGLEVQAVLLPISQSLLSHQRLPRSRLTLAFIPFEAFPLVTAASRPRSTFPSRRYAFPLFPVGARDLRALLHHQVRCRSAVLPRPPARCSLGLRSSSRFSLHPECSSEHPRGVTVVTVPPLDAFNVCMRPECADHFHALRGKRCLPTPVVAIRRRRRRRASAMHSPPACRPAPACH